MASVNGGEYQSGREVFEKFIPNYSTHRSQTEQQYRKESKKDTASELIDKLLQDFSRRLSTLAE